MRARACALRVSISSATKCNMVNSFDMQLYIHLYVTRNAIRDLLEKDWWIMAVAAVDSAA